MQIVHFPPSMPPLRLARLPARIGEGLLWIDLQRDAATDWVTTLEPWLALEIDPRHAADSLNPAHPSFFDGTPDYDMLVFAGLGPCETLFPLETRSATFFLFDRVLITIRAADALSFHHLQARIDDPRYRSPKSPLELTHQILDAMVDRFLGIRDPLDRHLNAMQDELLDDNGPSDWRALLDGRREVRRLEALCHEQLEALDAFKRGTRRQWSAKPSVWLRDLAEHIERVRSHAANLERDLEAAVQLHFAVATERTSRVVRTLTVLSAVFFPLTLITGIYGMNFEHMPELGWRYGYFAVLGLLLGVGLGLLLLFKRRGYF